MKRFRVIVTPEAQVGIRDAFNYIYVRALLNAERWIRKLYAEIGTLERFLERCAYAREREYLEEDLGSTRLQIASASLLRGSVK